MLEADKSEIWYHLILNENYVNIRFMWRCYWRDDDALNTLNVQYRWTYYANSTVFLYYQVKALKIAVRTSVMHDNKQMRCAYYTAVCHLDKFTYSYQSVQKPLYITYLWRTAVNKAASRVKNATECNKTFSNQTPSSFETGLLFGPSD